MSFENILLIGLSLISINGINKKFYLINLVGVKGEIISFYVK